MLGHIVSVLFPLFTISALGYLVGRRLKPDLSTTNRLNMDVFTPALVFSAMAGKDFHILQFLALALGALVIVMGSGIAGWGIARALRIDPKTLVPPLMFNNCGNLGLPVAVLAFGPQALAPAIMTFLVSNITQFSFGTWLLDHETRLAGIWRSPSILASIAGLAVALSGQSLWPPLLISVKMLGDISIPLMLFALGARLADSQIRSIGYGVLGAVLRPVLGMALAWAVLLVLPLPPQQRALLIIFGSLPPAVLNYIFAERYNQEPDKVASMVLIGNLASLIFLPIALAITLR
ncbi:AEC family transporter [Acidocella sp. KAb 2-4]|uniref:AEC family transporter n=1 Tax=Acidocella sp. KAb 2-4 TaxID=2885158 RepID=UPI001D07A18D|nr:AEC family transporter [Acidocella sp. KAb 2-4]MCB5943839.1 AEC family transporter [Acidocella sp. KAb 2-4]